MRSAQSPRRFHAYNIGVAKTGTASIASVFGRHKSRHEFMFPETVSQIIGWRENRISGQMFRDFILHRDRHGGLEMDSASFNHNFLKILIQEFPEAKFILTIRDCYSWLNSFLNMLLRWRTYHLLTRVQIPSWQIEYGRFLFGKFEHNAFVSSRTLLQTLPGDLDAFFRYWGESNRNSLELVPKERLLVIRTHEISQSLVPLARFLDLSPECLVTEASHANRAAKKTNLLGAFNPDLIEESCALYCQDLMDRFFPRHTFPSYLSGFKTRDYKKRVSREQKTEDYVSPGTA